MIQNVYKAFAWLKEHAEEYNYDADSIFVGGESAGAHLSSMAGAIATNPEYKAHFTLDEKSKDQKIAALMLNCGVYDMPKAVHTGFKNIGIYTQSYLKGTPVEECPEELQKEISPINWVTSDFPPTFAISAENDKLAVLTFDLVKNSLTTACNSSISTAKANGRCMRLQSDSFCKSPKTQWLAP